MTCLQTTDQPPVGEFVEPLEFDHFLGFMLGGGRRQSRMVRYDFRHTLGDTCNCVKNLELPLRDPAVTMTRAYLYGACKTALITFQKDGMQHQLTLEVDDKTLLLRLLQDNGVRFTSHFDLLRVR